MADPEIFHGPLSDWERDFGRRVCEIAGNTVANRAQDMTGFMISRPPSIREGGAFGPYSGPPGALRGSITSEVTEDIRGPVAKITAATPVGWFRNLGGHGNAAYSRGLSPRGQAPYTRRLRNGQLVTRYRRRKAPSGSYGRPRGDWRSIANAVDSMNGSVIVPGGVL